tara:strand:+ start:2367 stop:2687 length:321 start_codon:yes stop_codon:yes gene_type:complete
MRKYIKSYRRRNEPFLDSLPEQMHYSDTGCEASLSCLSCPLPKCKYDDPAWYQAYKRIDKDLEILNMYEERTFSTFAIAQKFKVSPRTIHRAVKRAVIARNKPVAA